jgi:LPS O-antigen subunit length determinant protein (WzzB/FepE family)
MVIWIFLGGIAGIGLVLGRHFLKDIRKEWNK